MSITDHLIFITAMSILMLIAFPIIARLKHWKINSLIEVMVLFVRDDIVIASMGKEGEKYTPYFCTLFFMILTTSLVGMIPFSKTVTGNLSVTGGLALTTFLLVNFMGIKEQGLIKYIKSFVPAGAPPLLAPLMFVLEIIGLFTKTIALAIRLFANMIAGHIVVICFISLIFIFTQMNLISGLITIPPSVGMSLFVNLLEILIIFIQAYIFTFLTAIFTSMAIHEH
ncbi:MAG: F0F1 ATP synthase subunit A [Elusimicrobiaceae bacterium]|nr:F0F1 ATP synthase subunit A [Elusimicrobiaceae bacterium]